MRHATVTPSAFERLTGIPCPDARFVVISDAGFAELTMAHTRKRVDVAAGVFEQAVSEANVPPGALNPVPRLVQNAAKVKKAVLEPVPAAVAKPKPVARPVDPETVPKPRKSRPTVPKPSWWGGKGKK